MAINKDGATQKAKPVILVVDDQPQDIELLEAYLVPMGYEIVKAANGEEALGKLSSNQIDLILLDVTMPGVDGFEVTRRVRGDDKKRLLPIILVTALKETEDRVKGIEAGCDDFISKPVNKMELFARIRSLLKVKDYNDLMSNYRKELESEVNRRNEELKSTLENLKQEITERKRAEEALKASEQNFRNSMDESAIGIRTVDSDGKTIYANRAILNIYGYDSIEELKATPVKKRYTPESYAEHQIRKEKRRRGEYVPSNYEIGIVRKDGEIRRLEVLRKEVRWNDEPQFQLLYSNITERKQAEKEKQELEAKAQVASRLAAVGEMAAGIAHEINNPLTGVIGFSQLLLEKQNIPEDIKDDIRIIADGSQRVADIVKRLLTFARQTKPIKILANLNELIENTLKLRDYVLKTANIEVITRFDPELPLSFVDPGQLQQVFLNLIVNAEQEMKKAHGKGTLTITTEKKGNNIRLTFIDDGPGINTENLGRLFEPFFTTKAIGEGTGLGLSLSRSIVLEHNGTLNVESVSGHGATFIIELPIIEALPSEVKTVSPPAKVEKLITKKGRILVVDDEPGVRALIEKVLTQSGHSVDTTGDASKAIDKLNAGVIYDVILIDVRMPGMNGTEMYSHILEKTPKMKNRIIFITGDVMGADIKVFLTQNNLPYLAKPFDIKLLKDKIEVIMMAGQPENDNKGRSSR